MHSPDALARPLLPECLDGRLTIEDFDSQTALVFEPNTWGYYKVKLLNLPAWNQSLHRCRIFTAFFNSNMNMIKH